MPSATKIRRAAIVVAGASIAALALASCSGAKSGGATTASGPLTIGTTDKIVTIDPAGEYDNGSFAVVNQVYPFLMNSPYGTGDVKPDIAESAEFTSPKEYTVKLKAGLTFANGHKLTSSDVKFSFDRVVKIADDNGPSSLLYNLERTEVKDDLTVVFHLKSENDQVFPQILSSPAGPIVDEEVFSADALTPDADIVKGKPFAGQYSITSYEFNSVVAYEANPTYKGVLPPAKTPKVNVKYYADAANLKLDIQQGNIDVAFRSLSATDIADLRGNDKVNVVDGPGGEIRYLVFNFDTMPFGAKTAEADPAKALAVRQAMADLIDRAAIAKDIFKDTFTPLYSFVPDGLTGANTALKPLYGDGNGAASADKAKGRLTAAGITSPVELNIQYTPEHYGPSSADEYAALKDQLEKGGLFKVNIQSTEWVQYSKDRTADKYPIYQLGWFPDYSDGDNYLTPFFLEGGFLKNHYSNTAVDELILKQGVTSDAAARKGVIEEIQNKVAADLSTIPMLQGTQVAVVGKTVTGAKETLDPSFKFRYAALSKG